MMEQVTSLVMQLALVSSGALVAADGPGQPSESIEDINRHAAARAWVTVDGRKVAARVNGRPVYEERVAPEVETEVRRFKSHGARGDITALTERVRARVLNRMIDDELILQESEKLTIEDIDERVNRGLQALEDKRGVGGRFERYLKTNGLTREGLEESLRARAYVDEYLKQKGISGSPIEEERIRKAYDENPAAYSGDEAIKVSHILVAVEPDADADERQRELRNAERLREELLAGQDFAEMARDYSDCNSASGGGDLRFIKKGYMPDEFDKVAFSLKEGEISEVVTTRFGHHIIKLVERRPAGVRPYDEVREFIKQYLQQRKSRKLLATHILELKKRATIEILE